MWLWALKYMVRTKLFSWWVTIPCFGNCQDSWVCFAKYVEHGSIGLLFAPTNFRQYLGFIEVHTNWPHVRRSLGLALYRQTRLSRGKIMLNHHFQQNEMKDISESASLKSGRKPVAELTNSLKNLDQFSCNCAILYISIIIQSLAEHTGTRCQGLYHSMNWLTS